MQWLIFTLLLAPVIDDANLQATIAQELQESPVVSVEEIDISVKNGIVVLEGEVFNLATELRAIEIARDIQGVRSVIDLLDVVTVPRSNEQLKRLVERRLAADETTRDESIEVEVRGGLVILKGEVDSRTEKQVLERIVQRVPGVQEIDNRVQARYRSSRDDADIQHDILQQFRWDTLLDDNEIEVSVSDGVVTLKGSVGTREEQWHARIKARVDGVKETNDELEIDPALADQHHRDLRLVRIKAPELEQAIRDAWRHDPRIHEVDVIIECHHGTVRLSGEVSSLPMTLAIEQTTRNTIGVTHVNNYLRVKQAEPRDDDEIKHDILYSLADDPIVDRFEIAVSVREGRVSLGGKVESYYERARAEEVTLHVPGIIQLRNRLEVTDDAPEYDPDFYVFDPVKATDETKIGTIHVKPDSVIKRAIESELWWSPLVDQDQVEVKVEAGIATLTGTVDSEAEARAAIDNAMQGGAVVVKNQLRIKSP